jgi:hypothetical protein
MEESMRSLGVVGSAFTKLANDLNHIAADYAQQAMALRAAVYHSTKRQTSIWPPKHQEGGSQKATGSKRAHGKYNYQQVHKRTRTNYMNPHPYTSRIQTSYKDPA